jgi:hypothetical protein
MGPPPGRGLRRAHRLAVRRTRAELAAHEPAAGAHETARRTDAELTAGTHRTRGLRQAHHRQESAT